MIIIAEVKGEIKINKLISRQNIKRFYDNKEKLSDLNSANNKISNQLSDKVSSSFQRDRARMEEDDLNIAVGDKLEQEGNNLEDEYGYEDEELAG